MKIDYWSVRLDTFASYSYLTINPAKLYLKLKNCNYLEGYTSANS